MFCLFTVVDVWLLYIRDTSTGHKQHAAQVVLGAAGEGAPSRRTHVYIYTCKNKSHTSKNKSHTNKNKSHTNKNKSHTNKNKFPRELWLFNLLDRHMQSPWSRRSFNFAIKLHNRELQCQSAECGDCFLCACDMCCFPCACDMCSLYLRRAVPMRTQANGSIAMRRGGSELCPPCCTPPQRNSLFCRSVCARKN